MQTKSGKSDKAESAQTQLPRPKLNIGLLLGLLSISFGLFAVVRVVWLILNVGGNNISNDYLGVVPFINFAFSGQHDVSSFLKNVMVGQHIVVLPILFHTLSAVLFDWNARAELLIGVGLNLIKALLIWDMVGQGRSREWRLAALGMISALVFSMTQAAVYFFGQACYPVSLTTLGFTLALWGIWKFKNDWRGSAIMFFGGVGAALSMGNVPPCWFALLVGLVLYGYSRKQWPTYLVWFVGAVVSMAPYLNYFFGKSHAMSGTATAISVPFMVNLLGRPFANQVGLSVGRLPQAEYSGITGLVLFALAIVLLARLKLFSTPIKTSLVLCAYALSSIVMLSGVRVHVAPWYGSFAVYFWIGLASILLLALPVATKAWRAVPIGGLCAMVFMYCASNKSWHDKHVYLITRAPASESGLRNYRNAPSYVESLIFQWGDGRPDNVTQIARPLEKYQLSAFSPDQTWSVQGDFVLPGVRVFQHLGTPDVKFLEDRTADHTVSWKHYERANLYLHAPNAVAWTMALPADVQSAKLKTALTIAAPDKRTKLRISDGVKGQIFAITGDPFDAASAQTKVLLKEIQATKQSAWLPLELDLSKYIDKTVTLIFTADGGGDKKDDFAVFQDPHLDVKLKRRSEEENLKLANYFNEKWMPVNTDLNRDFGKTFERTIALPPTSSSAWKREPLKFVTPPGISGNSKDNEYDYMGLFYTAPQAIPMSEASHLVVSMDAPKTLRWRSLKVEIVLEDGKRNAFSIPLPEAEGVHTSSYDLKLCQLPSSGKIKQVSLYPVSSPGVLAGDAIDVRSVSLAKEKPLLGLGDIIK